MFLIIPIIYFVVVVLPIVFWFWFFRQQDRAEPEPRRLLFKVFLGGIPTVVLASIAEGVLEGVFFPQVSLKLVAAGSAGAENFIDSPEHLFGFLAIFFLAGPVEEFMKFFVAKKLVYRKIAFNQVADGLIYAVTIALSFSLIENSIYFFNVLDKMALSFDFISIVIIRGIITTMLHVLAAAIMGLYLGRAKFAMTNKRKLMFKGVAIAALIHGVFNIFIFLPYGMLINSILLIVCYRYVMRELGTEKVQMVWKLVVPKESAVISNEEIL